MQLICLLVGLVGYFALPIYFQYGCKILALVWLIFTILHFSKSGEKKEYSTSVFENNHSVSTNS
jgi:hypothetical protein